MSAYKQTSSSALEKGVFRKLHPTEIAGFVKVMRAFLGLKQVNLATEAGISERTLQRIEKGMQVDDQVLERVAIALKQDKDALTKARYIPTEEEALIKAEQAIEKEKNDYQIVDLIPIKDINNLRDVFNSQAFLFDSPICSNEVEREIASFKDSLSDWSDIYVDISHSEKLDACLFGVNYLDRSATIKMAGL